jgi:cell wall-associated NlpC family hydrolase
MTWSDAYIGLPFEEKGRDRGSVDCWGLVSLVLSDIHGITSLPAYTEEYASTAERAELAAIFARDALAFPWHWVPDDEARPFDVVLFNRAGIMCHVGIVTERGRMLHVESGRESCVERYDIGRWATRFAGVRRHAELMR